MYRSELGVDAAESGRLLILEVPTHGVYGAVGINGVWRSRYNEAGKTAKRAMINQ